MSGVPNITPYPVVCSTITVGAPCSDGERPVNACSWSKKLFGV